MAIIIDGSGAVHDLVFAVAVNISHRNAVGSLTISTGICTAVITVIYPAADKLTVNPVKGTDNCSGVISSGEKSGWCGAVKVAHAGEKAIHPVSVTIPPTAYTTPLRDIINGIQCLSRQTIEHGQKFRPFQHVPLTVTVISIGITYYRPLSVHSAIRRFHGDFCPAILIEIIGNKLSIMGTGANIPAKVDTPKLLSFQRVSIQIRVSGMTGL